MRGFVHAVLYLTQDEERRLCICTFVGPKRWNKPCPWGELRNTCLRIQEAVLTGSGCLDTRPAQGCHFFQVRRGLFLYLGQDFYAKICWMKKSLGLPSKPVSCHSDFSQTGKQHFCKSSFVRCFRFCASCSFLLFCRSATRPFATGSFMHQVGLQVHVHFSLRFLKTLESMRWNRLLNSSDSMINVTLFHQAAARQGEGKESNTACCRGHNLQVSWNIHYSSRFQAEKWNLYAFFSWYLFSLLLCWIRQNAVFAPLLPLKILIATQSPDDNLSYQCLADFWQRLVKERHSLRKSEEYIEEKLGESLGQMTAYVHCIISHTRNNGIVCNINHIHGVLSNSYKLDQLCYWEDSALNTLWTSW